MALKSKVQGPRVWTVAELGAFYTLHRSELLAHSTRILKDSAKSEEVTQEALVKFLSLEEALEIAKGLRE